VLHMVGVVSEEPPEITFEKVNVDGTRHMLAEAARVPVPRFIFVSSLNAPSGGSGYHRSKRKAEAAVRKFKGAWTIVRPGNVHGPGDGEISTMLQLARGAMPVVPLIGDGEQAFQPIWWKDVARALANVVERHDLSGHELDIAGREVTCQRDIYDRLGRITGRSIRTFPLPATVAGLAAKAVSLVGWDVSFSDDQRQMLSEGNVIPQGGVNALTEILRVMPTSLDDGLRELADLQPEQLPDDGVGALTRKRYSAEIRDSGKTPELLFARFAAHFNDVTAVFVDVSAEPNAPPTFEKGATLTLALPLRGHVQVRINELDATSATLVTLSGHPLTGAVRFSTDRTNEGILFEVEVYERPANMVDFAAMRLLGDALQDHTWTHAVEKTIELAGGKAVEGIKRTVEVLSEEEAARVNKCLANMVLSRKREENVSATLSPLHPT
jgi:uncharacterized protein YbjT (DUF2867 family)